MKDEDKGEQSKAEKLNIYEENRGVYVNRGRRALLIRLLEICTATADDVYSAVELPAEIDPRCLGSVPGPLARAKIIHPAGFVKSNRPERHASYIQRWELTDQEAARQWLQDHPDQLETVEADRDSLFDMNPPLSEFLNDSLNAHKSLQDGSGTPNIKRKV